MLTERKTLTIKSGSRNTLMPGPNIEEELKRSLTDLLSSYEQQVQKAYNASFQEGLNLKKGLSASIEGAYEQLKQNMQFPSQSKLAFRKIAENVLNALSESGMDVTRLESAFHDYLEPKATLPKVPLPGVR